MATQTVATKKRRAWTTSVFVKQLMAISGFVFVFFLLFHSYGNLKMFLGQETYDHYAEWLHHDAFVPIFPHGGFLLVFRAAMLLFLAIHIIAAFLVWNRSRRARTSNYVVKKSAADAYAARTMRWTGVFLLFLIVFHLLQFTTMTVKTYDASTDSPFVRMVETFQNPLWVVVYAVFVGLACIHVAHGFWSAFQTLGWVRAGTRKFMVVLSGLVAALIFVMFMLPPLGIAVGLITLP